jgi:heat-inducible transcriptional repressor
MVEAAATNSTEAAHIVIHGQGRLFERAEFSDVEKIRRYLRTFEDQETLLGLLDRTVVAGGVQVLIGSETNLTEVHDISVISTDFSREGDAKGAVGVIGPARMDYGKVVPLLEFTASCVGDLLDEDESPEEA